MPEFTTHTTADAAPEQVLQVLTDPDEIASWSPIPFEVEDLDGLRLEAGSRARVSGSLAGKRVGFDIEVHAADEGGLELTAEGPIGIDVLYELEAVAGGSQVTRLRGCARRLRLQRPAARQGHGRPAGGRGARRRGRSHRARRRVVRAGPGRLKAPVRGRLSCSGP